MRSGEAFSKGGESDVDGVLVVGIIIDELIVGIAVDGILAGILLCGFLVGTVVVDLIVLRLKGGKAVELEALEMFSKRNPVDVAAGIVFDTIEDGVGDDICELKFVLMKKLNFQISYQILTYLNSPSVDS